MTVNMLSVNMLSVNMLSVIDWQYVVSHFHWLTIYCQSFSHLLSAILRVDIVTAIMSVSSTDWQDILSDFHCHFHCLTIHCQSWQYIVSRDNTLSVVTIHCQSWQYIVSRFHVIPLLNCQSISRLFYTILWVDIITAISAVIVSHFEQWKNYPYQSDVYVCARARGCVCVRVCVCVCVCVRVRLCTFTRSERWKGCT